ncbi:hypothetical protein BH10PSE1_BH10PSE1_33050 [soil metagenome]
MTVRPFAPADYDSVNALHRDVWWPERSQAGWRWLDANPARGDIDAPSGWVVEDAAGVPAAFVGNLIQRFWQDDVLVHGATGFSIIVPPTVRGASRSLIKAVVHQPGIFATYTFNANSKSRPLYARHGMVAWPPRTHDLKLSWIIDPIDCLQGRILREAVKRAPNLTDPYRERFMHRRLGSPRPVRLPARVSPLTDLGDGSAYAAFWQALKAEGRLIADRSPEILRWRLSDPDQKTPPVLIAFRRGDVITGYAMALMAKANPIEPAFLEILDLVALEGEKQAIPALMKALMAEGRALGAAKVRLQVVGEELLRRLGPWGVGARREGGWGHSHVRFHPGAPDHHAWSPTPFDADHAFCQRPVPDVRTRGRADRAGADRR